MQMSQPLADESTSRVVCADEATSRVVCDDEATSRVVCEPGVALGGERSR